MWGIPLPPALTFNQDVDAVWKGALARGGVKGVKLLRGSKNADGGELRSSGKTPVVILDYKVLFTDGQNAKGAWDGLAGNSDNWEQFDAIFAPGNGSRRGVGYTKTAYPDVTVWQSNFNNGGLVIPPNGPWSVRFLLLRPPKDAHPQFQLRWLGAKGQVGVLDFEFWQFQVRDGKAEVMRCLPAWTQAQEDQLATLLNKSHPTAADQDSIHALMSTLYADFEEVSLLEHESWYGQPHLLTFIPEPGGLLNIVLEGGKTATVKHSDLLQVRKPGVMWGASPPIPSPLVVRNTGGMFFLQVGQPQFVPTGQLRFGRLNAGGWISPTNYLNDLVYNGQFDSAAMVATAGPVPSSFTSDATLHGTTITVGEDQFTNEIENYVQLDTSDDQYTPFFYTLYALIPAGTRGGQALGGSGVSFDSATAGAQDWNGGFTYGAGAIVWYGGTAWVSLQNNNTNQTPGAGGLVPYWMETALPSIILDVQPEFDGEQTRLQYRVVLLDQNGAPLEALHNNYDGVNYPTLENRLADLIIAGVTQIKDGFIKKAEEKNQRAATPNAARSQVTHWYSEVHLTVCDQWAVLDDDLMLDDPVGDGMYLCDYVRLVLQGAGIGAGNMSGIRDSTDRFVSTPTGRRLPGAALGEPPCIRPRSGTTKRGEFLRELLDRWGLGHALFIDGSGIWNLNIFSPAVQAVFSSSGTLNRQAAGSSGRFAILEPLDWIRDPDGFYNVIRVEGKEHPKTGRRIVDEWHDHASIYVPASPRFIGRRKALPTVREDGARTLSDVSWVKRSLMARYGKAGRFFQFTSYYQNSLVPRMRISVDGTLAEIVRIPSGSLAEDRMSFVCREIT
jgi:hypothetical protein